MNADVYSSERQAEIFRTVDAEQRLAADPQASVWVAASAGTGKTKVLTDRVLRLLLAGSNPAEILCLTYTRAAAAEMSNRLYRRLARWATLPIEATGADDSLGKQLRGLGLDPRESDYARARALFTLVLDCAGGMRIQTIHAFCQSVLARFPLEARLPPGFSVLDEREAASLAQQSFEQMLTHVVAGPDTPFAEALLRLLSQLGETALRRLLTGDVLQKRALLTVQTVDAMLAEFGAILEIAPIDTEQTDETFVSVSIDKFDWQTLRTLAAVAAQGGKQDQNLFERIAAVLQPLDSGQQPAWEALTNIFLTSGEIRKVALTKGLAQEHAGLVNWFFQTAQHLTELESRRSRMQLYRTNRDLNIVVRGWLERVERVKRQRAALDYTDLINNARLLLAEQPQAWVHYKLDAKLKHVLVDEAQDTSDPQWQIVRSLTQEFFTSEGAIASHEPTLRTLFVVGDEKQSIYSFNGADPAAYAAARADYGTIVQQAGLPWADVPLSLSFRSTGAVLEIVNRIFADAQMRPHVSREGFTQHPARLGEAGLVEIWPPLLRDKTQGSPPWVLPFKRLQQQSPSVQLAERIATRIAAMVAGEPLTARSRLVRAGDIMVLVPRRTAFFPQLVRALKTRGVPVAGVDRLVLTSQLAVQDLLALVRFILLPEDDLTLATLLKTPFIGLSETQLFALCHARTGSLWQALQDRRLQSDLSEAVTWLERWRARVDFRRPHELLQEVLAATCPAYDARLTVNDATLSGRKALWRRLGPDALDPIDELLAEAIAFEDREAATLQHFLEWITATEIEKKRELTTQSDEVRIMTAHAAKGLEAPIVFVVDLPRRTLPVPSLLADGEAIEASPLLFVPPDFRGEAITGGRKLAAQAAQKAELLRLLYVALTRAEDRLYFCGAYSDTIPAHAWHWAVEPVKAGMIDYPDPLHPDGRVWRYETAQTKPVNAEQAVNVASQSTLPEWVNRPAPLESKLARPLTPSDASLPYVPVQSPAEPNAAQRFVRGTLTHKLLQYLPDVPSALRAAQAKRWLSRQAIDNVDLLRSVESEVLAIMDDPDLGPLFGPGSLAEVPLVGIVAGEVISCQVDRLLVTDDAILFVDYKTNRPPPLALDDIPAAYGRQLAYYAALLRQVYPNRTVRAALLWTDGPRLMQLPPEFLDGFLNN